jgi:hypothetical protein
LRRFFGKGKANVGYQTYFLIAAMYAASFRLFRPPDEPGTEHILDRGDSLATAVKSDEAIRYPLLHGGVPARTIRPRCNVATRDQSGASCLARRLDKP